MAPNLAVELHDGNVHALRNDGDETVLDATVFVHASTGRPGIDPGTGWYQRAELRVSGAALDPASTTWPADLYDGTVTVDAERFENGMPLPFDRMGRIRIELVTERGTIRVSGARIRIVLTGAPGEQERFDGVTR